MTAIGFLHPGSMGATLAATARADRLWIGTGRSSATVDRAAGAGMVDVGDIDELVGRSDVVVSICPPSAALDVAESVSAAGFDGPYVDANAISPETSERIGSLFEGHYIDGGVIGPPATRPGTTRLYLAGPGAASLSEVWRDSALDVRALSDDATGAPASALKMAYAGWTKGSSALLLAVNALAREAGVLDALHAEWDVSQPGLVERSSRTAGGAGPKAWRWVGEMAEIAATMEASGLPPQFHRGAEDLYQRMAMFKDREGLELDEVLDAITSSTSRDETA